MLFKQVQIDIGDNAYSIQCSGCLKVLGIATVEQKQHIFCMDCVNFNNRVASVGELQ